MNGASPRTFARSYLVALTIVGILASLLADALGFLSVTAPAMVVGTGVALALAVIRRHKWLGLAALSCVYVAVGTFFLIADVRYATDAVFSFRIGHQVGSAFHNHVFPHAALAVGLLHFALAAVTLLFHKRASQLRSASGRTREVSESL